MAKKRLRVLVLACATILVCLALIIAGTYALFSDSTKITNHLEAGTLDLTLTRISYSSKYLNDQGLLETRTGGTYDFSNPSSQNVFGLEAGAKLAPRSELSATLRISNEKTKSNVAFDYWVDIVGGGKLDPVFADQLLVTVTKGGETVDSFYLDELGTGRVLGGTTGLGLVKVGESQEFTVIIQFVDRSSTENNKAMALEADFDIVVRAVQTTTLAD